MIQVGDWVKIIGNFDDFRRHYFSIGSICKVVAMQPPFHSLNLDGCLVLRGTRTTNFGELVENEQYVHKDHIKKIS